MTVDEIDRVVWGCQTCGWVVPDDERETEGMKWHPATACPLCDSMGLKGIRGFPKHVWDILEFNPSWPALVMGLLEDSE